MTKVGYARVSTVDQDPELQLRALEAAGCDRVYTEHASGGNPDRPVLRECLDYLREGDTLVVWKLDRLGRSLSHLVSVLEGLNARGVEFASVTEGMDTTTAQGKLLFGIMACFAEFERNLIRERVAAGLAAARANGRKGGRRPVLNKDQRRMVHQLHADDRPVAEIARAVGTTRQTVYRVLNPAA